MFHTTNCRSVAEHGTSLAQRGLEEAAAWIPYAVCYAKKKTNKAPKDGQFLKQSWLFPFRNVGAVSNIPAPYVQADIPVSLGVCSLTSCTVSGAFFFHSHLQMSQTLFLYKRRIGNDCIGLGSFALLKCKLLKGKQNSVFSMVVLY